jgi:hypothetical protein
VFFGGTLVTEVDGFNEAKIGTTISCNVRGYNKDGVSDQKRASVQWAVLVNNKREELSVKGESISVEIQKEWGGMEILIIPYLGQSREEVSVKTYCYILEHEILKQDRRLNRLAAAGEEIDTGPGSEGPANTLSNAFVELNVMSKDDTRINYHTGQGDLLGDKKLVNATKLFEYEYMKKGIEECTGHIEQEIIVAVDRALRAGWRFDRHGNSEEYRLDGVYVGTRDYDYFGGIWVQNGYLKNVDGSVMKKEVFKDLVGTVYAEASTHGMPTMNGNINEQELRQEAGEIYCVMRNRAEAFRGREIYIKGERQKAEGTLLEAASETDHGGYYRVAGWQEREKIDIYRQNHAQTRSVIHGFITANRGEHEDLERAYFWDGKDIVSPRNLHYTRWGVTFSNPAHNIYRLPDKPILHKTSKGNYNYTLISTAAFGRTIFWRYTNEFKEMEQHPREYP